MKYLSLRKQGQISADRPEPLCLKCELVPQKQSKTERAKTEGKKAKLKPATLVPYAYSP